MVAIKPRGWRAKASELLRIEPLRERGREAYLNRVCRTVMANAPQTGAAAATRKGPWTEQEDLLLVWFVRLFGERRWDFLAKVSGLSGGGGCRPDRQELQAALGQLPSSRPQARPHDAPGRTPSWLVACSPVIPICLLGRWSRIARRLPGRTDNEIKNYWRTHMRKKAQERRTSSAPSPSSSSSSNISELRTEKHEGCSTAEGTSLISGLEVNDNEGKGYTMDQIWNEIAASESVSKLSFDEYKGGSACNMESPPVSSPIWEDCSASLWRMEDEDLCPMTDLLLSNR
ncbi:hypothetical protein BHE74_00002119 [Ensete ventricosum]|nr:hypothetical protein BHE74_00002119 [Ensete ventricosum]RZR80718.1 hypothetical protein BHM03_00006782 [Ensete ventricosum]